MALSTVTTGNTILASDVNQLVNVLQKPSGATESGAYFIEGGVNASGWTLGQWISSLSRNTTPVSVSIDTTLQAPTSLNAPTTQQLNANGFYVIASATGASNTARVGGLWTIQY